MKTKLIEHAGKGSRPILPSKSAVQKIIRGRSSLNQYAKAGPNVVQNGPSITERKP